MHLKKYLGQHLLLDKNLLEFIVRKANIKPDELILEIGTGTGSLTEFLAHNSKYVVSVEIDSELLNIAKEKLSELQNITFINANILQGNKINRDVEEKIKEILKREDLKRAKVVSNLPYSDATRIILGLLESNVKIKEMIIMVQLEVAKRICAQPSSSDYGPFTIFTKIFSEAHFIRTFPPDVFRPKPKVKSALVSIQPRKKLIMKKQDYECFKNFIKAIFSYRRKFIKSALRFSYDKEDLEGIISKSGIEQTKRCEEFSCEELISIFNYFKKENVFSNTRKLL